MKVVRGIKLGGLQQKIFNLILVFISALIIIYLAIGAYQQKSLRGLVEEAGQEQQDSIRTISEETMQTVLKSGLITSTGHQAAIADDLFSDVRSDVLSLQAYAKELFENADRYDAHTVDPPDASAEGTVSAYLVHESTSHPENSDLLKLVGNMSDIMTAMYTGSDKLASVFVGTADGNMVLVNDRPGTYVTNNGTPLSLNIRQRSWYRLAENAGELIFTGVEKDAFTESLMLECAAPVYYNGELAAVVAADIYLDSVREFIEDSAPENGFLCIVNSLGQVVFSSSDEGLVKAELSVNAPDLRSVGNAALSSFVTSALRSATDLTELEINGTEYYMTGAPMNTIGWAVISAVDKAATLQPTELMLSRYQEIAEQAEGIYREGFSRAVRLIILLTIMIAGLAIGSALILASRTVKPLEEMTKRIDAIGGSNQVFEMEDSYRTNDEIEILAESFATLTRRTKSYIAQITEITAEKERIGTELALATQIQADMLPNIFPAFPERPEFDIYASMSPAKEVGGDFYDFFLIDESHLGLVMADVSGKGVPAALFMMVSKILVQNYTMTGRSPKEALEAVNRQICSNNREEMFVTVWLGILEIPSGKITAVNAGHEYPAVCLPDGRFELVKNKHGMVVGIFDEIRYKEYEMTLAPGSRLFLYTDGVPEATDTEGAMFTTDRMLDALNQSPCKTPAEIIGNVRKAMDGFVNGAEPFDDTTMLCLVYKGPAS